MRIKASLSLFVALLPLASWPCAIVGSFTVIGARPSIANETAIILWNAKTNTEHFVRGAEFVTGASELGFLVPTPTIPTLHDFDFYHFETLKRVSDPRNVASELTGFYLSTNWLPPAPTNPTQGTLGSPGGVPKVAGAVAPPVRIVSEQTVGQYSATILIATDANALSGWLAKHKFQQTAEVARWLETYVKDGWYITAFKLSNTKNTPVVTLPPVRMTFKTERPFYPYREPQSDNPASVKPRMLRVFMLADSRMDGMLGQSGSWPGKVVWSNRLPELDWSALRRFMKQDPRQNTLPEEDRKAAPWMTVYEDASAPRLGTDEVYFAPSSKGPVERPPIRIIWDHRKEIPLAVTVPVGVAVLGTLVWMLRRRRARAVAAV
jgi:hypothetical protein